MLFIDVEVRRLKAPSRYLTCCPVCIGARACQGKASSGAGRGGHTRITAYGHLVTGSGRTHADNGVWASSHRVGADTRG
jgi:hypothetical protein